MIAESVLEQRSACDRIAATIAAGEIDRTILLRMVKDLGGVSHQLNWEVNGRLRGRSATAEMHESQKWIASANGAIEWAESHAAFALMFELARSVNVAAGALRKVVERLEANGGGAAA